MYTTEYAQYMPSFFEQLLFLGISIAIVFVIAFLYGFLKGPFSFVMRFFQSVRLPRLPQARSLDNSESTMLLQEALKLKADIEMLEAKKRELENQNNSLRGVSEPTIKHILDQLRPGEKQSAQRDYVLFILGMVFSTFISIILSILRIGS